MIPVITVYEEPQWLSPRTRNPWRHTPWTVIVKRGPLTRYHRFESERQAREFAATLTEED